MAETKKIAEFCKSDRRFKDKVTKIPIGTIEDIINPRRYIPH